MSWIPPKRTTIVAVIAGLLSAPTAQAECPDCGAGEREETDGSPAIAYAENADHAPVSEESLSLPGPSRREWQAFRETTERTVGRDRRGRLRKWSSRYVAIAEHLKARVYDKARADSAVAGFVMRDGCVAIESRVRGKGCSGRWFRVEGGGYICTSNGFDAIRSDGKRAKSCRVAASQAPLPFRYVKVLRDGTPRFEELPDDGEASELFECVGQGEDCADWPSGIEGERLMGAYFLAVSGEKQSHGIRYLETVAGRYVRAADVEEVPASWMHGELLGAEGDGEEGRYELPLAFVYVDGAELLRPESGELRVVGRAAKHARFAAQGIRHLAVEGDRTFVAAPGQLLVDRSQVRIADAIARPDGVGANEKWIHVNLAEQTVVAYEGDTPVFASLVSSGKPGHDTPTGLYRIRSKHHTVTMDGPDPDRGFYQVEEVPWTMYYYRGMALHGAYWHNVFGNTRSHGCTNIAPADARWLYYWTEPAVPRGWHGVRNRPDGTWVYFTP